MKKKFNYKPYLPHVLAIVGAIVVFAIYFSPVLKGKALRQHDIVMAKAAQKEMKDHMEETGELTLWTNAMFSGMPTYQIWMKYPKNIATYFLKVIKLKLGEPISYMFIYFIGLYIFLVILGIRPALAFIGGMAFAFSSYNVINIEAGHLTKGLAVGIAPLVLAGVVLALKRKYIWGFVLTAIALGMEIRVNHLQITYYLFIMILILMIVEFIHAIKNKEIPHFIKASAFLLVGVAFAVLVNITALWTTQEYSKVSMRGGSELQFKSEYGEGLEKSYALAWSYGVNESFTLLIPRFAGGSSSENLGENSKLAQAGFNKQVYENAPTYWGALGSTGGAIYIGAIIIFLFVFGFMIIGHRYKWWLLITAVLSLMLAWGSNFLPLTDLFFDYFPLYNKFRVPMTLLLIVGLSVPILSFLTLEELLKGNVEKEKIIKSLKYALYGVGGLLLFMMLFAGSLFDFKGQVDAQLEQNKWPMDALYAERLRILRLDALRSLIYIGIIASAIYFFAIKKLKPNVFIIVAGLAIIIDMMGISLRYFNKDDFEFTKKKKEKDQYVQMTPADQAILMDTNIHYRVLDMVGNSAPWSDASGAYFHKLIGGYHGAKMARYQDLIDYQFDIELRALGRGIVKEKSPVINMLNTRYIRQSQQVNGVYPLQYAQGNAWFVKDALMVESPEAEIAALYNPEKLDEVLPIFMEKGQKDKRFRKLQKELSDPSKAMDVDRMEYQQLSKTIDSLNNQLVNLKNFDLESHAIIGKDFKDKVGDFIFDESGQITLVKYEPNDMVYKSNASSDQLAVFSEIYYQPGWDAYIDGKPAEHFRANYVLRAMMVPAGEHTIEFKFEPKSYYTGEKISGASSLILFLIVIGTFIYQFNPNVRKKVMKIVGEKE